MVNKTEGVREIAERSYESRLTGDLIKRVFPANNRSVSRVILSGYGLAVPYIKVGYWETIDALRSVNTGDPKEIKQQALNRISLYSFTNHRKELKSYCLVLSDLAREAGLHFMGVRWKDEFNLILQSISKAGIVYKIFL